MPADYHTHTPLCRHAKGTPEEYVARAVAAGLHEYGISDHAPMTPEPFDDWRMDVADMPRYLEWIERARAAAPDSLAIRCGLECDWLPGCERWTDKLSQMHEWDYLIGSVHYIAEKWDFDNPKWLGRWAQTDVDGVWCLYWAEYQRMVESGLFQVYGHADLIKKFRYRPEGSLSKYYDPVIKAMAAQGGVMELNTAGWHKPCEEQYPALEFLEKACSAGVGLIISSDAHHPDEVARDFAKARDLAALAGYKETQRISRDGRSVEPLI